MREIQTRRHGTVDGPFSLAGRYAGRAMESGAPVVFPVGSTDAAFGSGTGGER